MYATVCLYRDIHQRLPSEVYSTSGNTPDVYSTSDGGNEMKCEQSLIFSIESEYLASGQELFT